MAELRGLLAFRVDARPQNLLMPSKTFSA